MTSINRLLFFIFLAPALLIGCGSSNADPVNNKEGDFFGDGVSQNTSISVADLVFADGRFDIFAEGLAETNLTRTLDRPGPYTVFAPTDGAFNRLPTRVRNILRNNPSLLRQVLLHHIVNGTYSEAEVLDQFIFTTLQGERVRVRRRNGSTFIGSARIIQVNGFVGNGVVHVIDEVIIPRSLRLSLGL